MKRVMLFAAVAALIAMGPGSLLAQPQQSPSPSGSGRTLGAGTTTTIASDSLIGAKVRDTQGNEIGQVKTLLIDPRDGKIVSLMISRGGALGAFGIGGKQEAVSWDDVEVQRDDQQKIVVTMRQSTLERAPRSDRPQQPQQQPSASPPTGSTQPSESTPPTGSAPPTGSTPSPGSTPYPGSTPRQ